MQGIHYKSYLLIFVMISPSITSSASTKNRFFEWAGIQVERVQAIFTSPHDQEDKELRGHLTQCSLALHEQELSQQQKFLAYTPSYDTWYEQSSRTKDSCELSTHESTHDVHEQLDTLIARNTAEAQEYGKQWYKENAIAIAKILRKNPRKYLNQAYEQEVTQEQMHREIARLANILDNHDILLNAPDYKQALISYQQALKEYVALHALETAIDPDLQSCTWSSTQQEQSAEDRRAHSRLEALHGIGSFVHEAAYLQDSQEQSDQVIGKIQQEAQASCAHEFDKADALVKIIHEKNPPKTPDCSGMQGIDYEPSQPLGEREFAIIAHLQPKPITRAQWMWQKRYHIALGTAVIAGSIHVLVRHKDELIEKALQAYEAVAWQLERVRAALRLPAGVASSGD